MDPRIDPYPLDVIDPNPFQPRLREDPDHVRRIADSIKAHGLKQIPVGRVLHGDQVRVQLGAGMTRLAAFRLLLAETGDGQYAMLPVHVQSLTDQEMFETAVVENHDRKDLTPTELARSMKTYRDRFGKTSKQIGALYGLDDATVRNYLRLLDLPSQLQGQVDKGEISQATARKFLAAQAAVSDPERLVEAANKIIAVSNDGPASEREINDAVRSALDETKSALLMHDKWSGDPPRAGKGLWLLSEWTIKPGNFPKVKSATLAKAYPAWERDPRVKAAVDQYGSLAALIDEALDISRHADGPSAENLAAVLEIPLAIAQVIDTLNYPPVCARCPFHATIDRNHYCGIKLCHNHKKQVFLSDELSDLSEKLGIPVYDPEKDGPDYDESRRNTWGSKLVNGKSQWGQHDTEYVEWFEQKAAHLRLMAAKNNYSAHDFTNSYNVCLVSVREELRGQAAKAAEEARRREEDSKNDAETRERERHNRNLAEAFVWWAAQTHFAFAFSALKPGLAQVIFRNVVRDHGADLPEDPGEARSLILAYIAQAILWNELDWQVIIKGPEACAKHLAGLATEMGAVLPADFVLEAAEFTLEKI